MDAGAGKVKHHGDVKTKLDKDSIGSISKSLFWREEMIRIGIKGRITKGLYSPKGELIVKDNETETTSGYYIYVWPNDGTKWPETDKDMVYDAWLEDWDWVESYFKHRHWEVEWYDEEEDKKK